MGTGVPSVSDLNTLGSLWRAERMEAGPPTWSRASALQKGWGRGWRLKARPSSEDQSRAVRRRDSGTSLSFGSLHLGRGSPSARMAGTAQVGQSHMPLHVSAVPRAVALSRSPLQNPSVPCREKPQRQGSLERGRPGRQTCGPRPAASHAVFLLPPPEGKGGRAVTLFT